MANKKAKQVKKTVKKAVGKAVDVAKKNWGVKKIDVGYKDDPFPVINKAVKMKNKTINDIYDYLTGKE